MQYIVTYAAVMY